MTGFQNCFLNISLSCIRYYEKGDHPIKYLTSEANYMLKQKKTKNIANNKTTKVLSAKKKGIQKQFRSSHLQPYFYPISTSSNASLKILIP